MKIIITIIVIYLIFALSLIVLMFKLGQDIKYNGLKGVVNSVREGNNNN